MQSNTSETTERDMVAAAGHDYLGKSRLKTAPPIQKRLIQYYKFFFRFDRLFDWPAAELNPEP